MANQPVTREKLINADKDVQVIEDFIKKPKDETVTTRFGDEIMTLKGLEEEVKKSGGYFKRYATLAAANSDIANIPVNSVVKVTDAVNGGDYEKAAAGATILTKSAFDPLTQAKADASTKANAAEANAKAHTDELITGSEGNGVQYADDEGFILFGIRSSENKTVIETSDDDIILRTGTSELLLNSSDTMIVMMDDEGFMISVEDYTLYQDPIPEPTKTDKISIVAELESATVSMMNSHKQHYKQPVATLKKGLNIFIVYGQSLSVGTEAYTVVTRTPSQRGNLMLGDSPRGRFSNPDATYLWETMGGSNVYKPLVETAQGQNGDIVDLDTFTMTAQTFGETVLSGMLESIKELHNRDAMVTNDTNVVLAGSCVGAAGATINTFIKSANKYFSRFQGCLQAHKEAALAAGYADVQVAGLVYMQGESDSSATKETYLANLTQLRADMVSEVKTVFGQQNDPAFFLYQIGGLYPAATSTNMGTSEAQLSFAENDGVFLLDNEFGYPAPNMHMYANSYRWLGCRFSKTIYNVLKNRKEITFKINDAVYLDGCVYVSFNVPDAPLKTQTVYNRNTPVNLTNLGFYVRNSASQGLNISSVTLASPSVYKITLAEPITDQLSLFFGSYYTQGVHNVCDSSQELAVFNWQYYGDKQQRVGENIADLVNKPYLLNAKPAVQFISVRSV